MRARLKGLVNLTVRVIKHFRPVGVDCHRCFRGINSHSYRYNSQIMIRRSLQRLKGSVKKKERFIIIYSPSRRSKSIFLYSCGKQMQKIWTFHLSTQLFINCCLNFQSLKNNKSTIKLVYETHTLYFKSSEDTPYWQKVWGHPLLMNRFDCLWAHILMFKHIMIF